MLPQNIMSKASFYSAQSHRLDAFSNKNYHHKLNLKKTTLPTSVSYNQLNPKYLWSTVILMKLYQSVMFNSCLTNIQQSMVHQRYFLLKSWNFHIMAYTNILLRKSQMISKSNSFHFWMNWKIMKHKVTKILTKILFVWNIK